MKKTLTSFCPKLTRGSMQTKQQIQIPKNRKEAEMRMSNDCCDFCDEFSAGRENSFVRIYGPDLESRILFRSTDFAVVPSLGQIVEGYLLIVPTTHFTAMADLPAELQEELLRLSLRVSSVLSQV